MEQTVKKAAIGDNSFIDRVLNWLEGSDTEFEKIFAYSVCLAAITFVAARFFME